MNGGNNVFRCLLHSLWEYHPDATDNVLEGIEAAKRYLFTEGSRQGVSQPYQGGRGPAPTNAQEFCDLLNALHLWSLRASGPDMGALLEFVESERRGRAPVTSGFIPPQLPATQQAWNKVMYTLDLTLNRLKTFIQERPAEPETPWSGDDWEHLEKVPRRLLEYMHNKKSAQFDDRLCQYVWGEPAERVTSSALHTAKSKANAFLLGREWGSELSKSRGDGIIRWVSITS